MRPLLCTALFAIAACAGNTGSGDVKVSDRAVVADQELKDLMQVLPDRIVVTTPRADIHRRLFGLLGHTFVSGRTKDSAGYVREVLSVERSGDATTLMTSTSSLDKVIETGSIHASQDFATMDLGELGTQAFGSRRELAIPDVVLFDASAFSSAAVEGVSVKGQVKIEGGTLEFAPTLDLDAEYDHGLESFELSARGEVTARLTTSAKIEVKAEQGVGSENLWKKTTPFKRQVKLLQSPRARSFFMAGAVPVEYATSYTVDLTCTLTLEGSFEGRAGGTFTGKVETGARWKKGRTLETPGSSSFRFDAFADAKVGHDLELECGLKLGLKLELYEVVGGTLSVGPYVKYATNNEKRRLEMWWGVKGELEGELEILGAGVTLKPEEPLFTWPKAEEEKPMKTWSLK